MSPTTRPSKKHAKAKQRRRLKAQERLARDRRQAQRAAVALPDRPVEASAEESMADQGRPSGGGAGLADDPALAACCAKQQHNVLATLLLSQGVPMLGAGDEMGRTQQGNANAYDQDNARSWLEWALTPEQQALLDFTRTVVALAQHHPVLRRRHFWHGQRLPGSVRKELAFYPLSSSNNSLASWRSAVSKPSVNQP